MDLAEAKILLDTASRWELRDHSFGDSEFGWTLNDKELAVGYSSGTHCDVTVYTNGDETFNFYGDEARELKTCGTKGLIGRNDETGPDEYVEGQIMPGLTVEGVLDELTNPKK